MFLTVTLVVSAVTLIYVYLSWYNNYWRKRGVPGPAPRLLLGNFPSFILRHRSFVEEIEEIYNKFRTRGNFIGVFNGRQPTIMVLNPSMVKDVLIKDFKNFQDNEFADSINKESDPIFGRNPFMLKGEEWKQKRAEVTPAFTTSRMKSLFPLIEDVALRADKFINDNKNQPIETRELCAKYTTDVVSSCIFAADAQSFTSDKAEIREMGRKLMEPNFQVVLMFLVLGFVPALKKLMPISFVPKHVERFFTQLMEDAVAYREKNNVQRADYLDYLIGLRSKKHLDTLDMAAHGVSFFVDGFETSSLGMSFALYELARNPDVQTKLRVELLAARNEKGSVDYETLLELPYLDQVLNESLRLWPPAAFLSKVCTNPTELELYNGKKVSVERGMPVMIPVWSLHRDPDSFEEPERYNPDRFSPETGGIKPFREKGCFIPFGDGPRQCLGMRFAQMQVKRGLFEIITKFEVSVNRKTENPIKLDPKAFIVCPLNGLCGLLAVVYLFLTWEFGYWEKYGVRGPKPKLLFGNLPFLLSKKRHMLYNYDQIYNDYKDEPVVGYYSVRTPQLMVRDPDLIKEVLSKGFQKFADNDFSDTVDEKSDPLLARNPFSLSGEKWKTRRAEITPAFTNNRIKALVHLMDEVCERMNKYVKTQAAGNGGVASLDAKELMTKYTTDVVASCIFAIDAQSFVKENPEIRAMGKRIMNFNLVAQLVLLLTTFVPSVKRFYKFTFIPRDAEEFFIRIMRDAIRYRKENNINRTDYLDHLLQLQDRKQITDIDIAGHGVSFFADGFETSSMLLTYCLYDLATNRDVQEALRAEIRTVRQSKEGGLSFENLMEMVLLEEVICESLRMHPIISVLSKRCTADTTLVGPKDRKIVVKKGTTVTLPYYSISFDPKYYEDPYRYNPERFSPANGGSKAYRERGVYFPFGDGPRMCLGMRFAQAQVKRAIVEIIENFQITVSRKTKEPFEMDSELFMLFPKGSIWLDFKPIA
ncbi:probable cytochrome P450 28a5 [Anopheles aquasalis]|nr:probable cytochrome P450 28a5 [Anopheles aquasalis]